MNATADAATEVSTWPAHHAVAHLPGSLPMGGVVPMTPVHAFAQTPAALALEPKLAIYPTRMDVELGGLLAFVIDQVVTDAEADAIACGASLERPAPWITKGGAATPTAKR